MSYLRDFWAWATSRPGVIIVLAIIVATVVIVSMTLENDQSLYDAIIRIFEILVGTPASPGVALF